MPRGATLLAAGSSLTCIPTGAHATGAGGTNWRTDVEVHNPGATQAAYSITLLKRDNDNGSLPADATRSFTLDPGLGARYTDIIDAVFHFSGAAALRITATSGTILVTSRTYNQLGSGNPYNLPVGSTFGQFVPAFADTNAITSTEEGRLIQLSHTNYDVNNKKDYRANIGVVNAANGTINLAIDL
ncbi:MAG: hypothetical protein HY825_09565, partial [Acidobacteria bacterium]|nr:hypothetical protein [Acidobacteriota bacterium]